jgi:hypothetical protein
VKTVFVDNVAFKTRLSRAELAKAGVKLNHDRALTKALTDSLLKAIKSGSTEEQAQLQHFLATHTSPIFCSAITANKKLPAEKRATFEQCLDLPSLLDFTSPLSEPVAVYPKPKKSGGVRMIHKHGPLHRTSQDIVLRMIGPYFKPRPFQYTQSGVHKAIAKAKDCVKSGLIHTARLDIKDYFVSFDPKKLTSELPLPSELVEHVVVGRHMKVVMDQDKKHGHKVHGHGPKVHEHGQMDHCSLPHSHEHLLTLARLGIPQGSGCSPIVGMFCISRLGWVPTPGVMLINYADDFLLLAQSDGHLKEAIEKLTAAVANLPGGHFVLNLKGTSEASKGIEFLGHRLRITQGKLVTSPTDRAIGHFWAILTSLDEKLWNAVYPPGAGINKKAGLVPLARLVALIDGWSGAFRECDDLNRVLDVPTADVQEWLKKLGLTMPKVKAATDPSMRWSPGDYSLELG